MRRQEGVVRRALVAINWIVTCGLCLAFLFVIVRAGAGHSYRFTYLEKDSATNRPSLVGRQLTFSVSESSLRADSQTKYLFLMPSCNSCTAGAIDARIAEQESSATLVFVYPDSLDLVPRDQLPVAANSVALSSRDVKGLSSLDYMITPAILAIDRDFIVIAQTSRGETFEQLQERVSQ